MNPSCCDRFGAGHRVPGGFVVIEGHGEERAIRRVSGGSACVGLDAARALNAAVVERLHAARDHHFQILIAPSLCT